MDNVWKGEQHKTKHTIANNIGPKKSKGLPIFHSVTGCNTVSPLSTIRKKTAWEAWKAFKEMDSVFDSLADKPEAYAEHLQPIEHFVVICYNRVSEQESVNEERQYIFTKKGRDVNSIPPTKAALHEHIKRTVYQRWVEYS